MPKTNLTNYYQELIQYFQVFGTMLDIGCRSLDYLFQFDNSKFKKLIGIDIKLPEDPFQNYFEFKNPNSLKLEYDYLESRFLQKYKFFEKNILDFHIKRGLKEEDWYKVREYLTLFHEFKNIIKREGNSIDINQYKTLPFSNQNIVPPYIDRTRVLDPTRQ